MYQIWGSGENGSASAVTGGESAVGKRPLTGGIVQCKAASGVGALLDQGAPAAPTASSPPGEDPFAMHTIGAFPHGDAIQRSTGHAVPGTATVDAAACAARGAEAFTDGTSTTFASATPDVHVAAHEAAHQLQHAGATHDAGLGAEGHAHHVADAVAGGGSACDLIGSAGAPVASAVRNYTRITEADQTSTNQWKAGGNALVGDQGRTITTDADKHLCYADPALITEANDILKAKKSGVRIKPGGAGPSGDAPDGSGFKSTVKVDYNILGDEDNKEFLADCGHSAREVMGESGQDSNPHAVYDDGTGKKVNTADSKNPAKFRDEIFVKGGLGPDGPSAHAAYNALDAGAKDAFDKKHGINKYAAPGVGEAFTRRRDDELGGTGFNFHWGGVIMVAGDDRVTFENYTKGKGYDAKDEDWYFATYGMKPGQSWHEKWVSVGGAGKGTTVAAATSADPSSFIKGAAAMTTAELCKQYLATSEPGEKMAIEAQMRERWIKITVSVKKAQEGKDDVYVKVSHGGKEWKSSEMKMRAGDRNTFWAPIDKIAPITGKVSVQVYDWDVFSDDMISNIGFQDPWTPTTDDKPWDGAEYSTTVEFDR